MSFLPYCTILPYRSEFDMMASHSEVESMKKTVTACGLLVVACIGLLYAQTASVDLLIRGGTVMDGTGSEPVLADVGIKADRIEFIGDSRAARVTATRTIDATG